MARSVSARPISGTSATSSPLAGFVTLIVAPESAATHCPASKVRLFLSKWVCDNLRGIKLPY